MYGIILQVGLQKGGHFSEKFPEDAKKILESKKKFCNISDIYWKCFIF